MNVEIRFLRREQASEQAQWAALSERKFLEQKAVAAKLEETVAMVRGARFLMF